MVGKSSIKLKKNKKVPLNKPIETKMNMYK